jgi:hypothetical protein
MDNERKFQGQGNEANMSASKTCNAAPNEESQRGGQRSGLDVATTRPQTELNQAAEIGVSLPKTDAAVLQTAVESQQSVAARSEVGSVPAAPSSDPATRTGYAEREASGGDNGPALQAGKELPAGHHEGSRTPVTDSHGRTTNDPDSAGVKLTAPVQPSGELAAPETMTDNPSYGPFADIEQTRSRPRRRWVWWVVVGVGVLGLVIGPIGIWLTVVWFGGLAQLESAMAEADAIYPHWRWEDLSRQREQVPPEENAWPLIEQIAARYRANPYTETLERNQRFWDRWNQYLASNPNRYLPAELSKELEDWIAHDRTLPLLIEQVNRRRRAQAPWPYLGGSPPLPYPISIESVLWRNRSALAIMHEHYLNQERYREAEIAVLAAWKVVTALDDIPSEYYQSIGSGFQNWAIRRLERHLLLTEFSQENRQIVRQLLERQQEIARQRIFWAIRAERALAHERFEQIRRGELSLTKADDWGGGSSWLPSNWGELLQHYLWDKPKGVLMRRFGPIVLWAHQHQLHAEAISDCNRLEKAANKSDDEVSREWKSICERRLQTWQKWWFTGNADSIAGISLYNDALRRSKILLEAAKAGLAAEEFRVEHGRLPHDWNELVPRYLPSIPHDSFAGGPFQFKTTADGIVIYSVGTDRKDDGGDPERDIVFRVYHRDKRGLPPVPFKPSAHP